MTLSPNVTWPSAAMTTLPLRRTQRTVVERIRGRVSDAWVFEARVWEACRWGFCPENKEAALTAGWEDDRLNMFYISISQPGRFSGRGRPQRSRAARAGMRRNSRD